MPRPTFPLTEKAYQTIMESHIFRRNGRVIDLCGAFTVLCRCIKSESKAAREAGQDTEGLWWMDDGGECSLADLIPAAYWAFKACHRGQNSPEYATACALGGIYSPGMDCEPEEGEPGHFAYESFCKALTA